MGNECPSRYCLLNTPYPWVALNPSLLSRRYLPDLPENPPRFTTWSKIWSLSSPNPLRSVKSEPEPRQPVRTVARARLDVTMLGPSVATAPCRGSSATIPKPHLHRTSKIPSTILGTSGTDMIHRSGFDSGNTSNNEVLQRLNHIAGMLEEIKSEGSTHSSTRSLKESFFELGMQNTSPTADSLSGSNTQGGSTASFDDRGTDHDPRILYMASSGENMLRWPIFNKVITEAERHIRSFLLDSLDNQPHTVQPPRQVGIGSFVDEIPRLCKKYFLLCHRRNPILDLENLDRYAKEVTVQGLGWDGPSCQVVCHIGSRPDRSHFTKLITFT